MTEARLTLCIIDDTDDVVTGIATAIPWGDHGIDVCGTATDGMAGLELIRSLRPDIVITDIRMPMMDGLEMSRAVLKQAEACQIIFITGYTDFEYAQQALKLGAFDLITKPFSTSTVLQVVLQAQKELLEQHRIQEHYREMESKIRHSLPILRQEYFQLLLRYPTSSERAKQRWDFLQVEMEAAHFAVMVIEIDDFTERCSTLPIHEVELIRFTIQNILEESIAPITKGLVFRDGIDRFVAVINVNGEEEASVLADLCRDNITQYSKYSVSVGLGLMAERIEQLPSAYEQALSALSFRFYSQGNTLLRFRDFESTHGQTLKYSLDKEKELFLSMYSGNGDKAVEALELILQEFADSETMLEPQYMKSVHYELALMILRAFMEKVPYDKLSVLDRKVKDSLIDGKVSLQDMRLLLKELCREGCKLVTQLQATSTQSFIDQAIDYIKAHLHDNITVQECAKTVHISASYFAGLFKKTTGMTFTQFLIMERMEKAKAMIVAGAQVQEVSAAVGYEDRRYFSELFKKHTGVTPTEFRSVYIK